MKRFNNSEPQKLFEKLRETVYCPFDPKLHIGGEKNSFYC